MKYLAIALILIAVVATVIHTRRDAIARGLANRALQQYGVTTESLSIERLGTNRVVLSRLFLSREDGSRFEITDLSFPVSFPSEKYEQISIGRVEITLSDSQDQGAPVLAELLDLALSLPALVPNAEVTVGEVVMVGLPRVRQITWRTEDDDQALAFTVHSVEISASLDGIRETAGRAALQVSSAGEAVFAQELTIERSEPGYTVGGRNTIELAPWLPLLEAAGLVSPATASLEGSLAVEVSVDLPRVEGAAARIEAQMIPVGELRAGFRRGDESMTLRTVSGTPFLFRFGFPDFDWTMEQARSELVADVGLPLELPLRFDDLDCRRGIVCTVDASIAIASLEDESIAMRDFSFSTPLDIAVGEDSAEIAVSSDAILSVGELRSGDVKLGPVTATRFSGAGFVANAAGWSAGADFLDLTIASATAGDLSASLPLSLSGIQITESGDGLSARYSVGPGESVLTFGDFPPIAPGVDGEARWGGGRLATTFTVTGDRGDELASVTLEHDPANGTGNAKIADAGLDMNRKKLSQFWRNWPYELDVVAGRWAAEADLSWRPGDGETLLISGSANHQARGLSGAWDDIAFVNLSTSQAFEIDAGSVLQSSPSELTIGLLEIGVPIENVAVGYTIDFETRVVHVERASASLLGGVARAGAFDYDPEAESTTLPVALDAIQLSFISGMIGFESVSMSGSVSGALPVTLRGETLTVSGGRLESDPPGGRIRYSSGVDGDGGKATSSLGIVLQAMSNFEYEKLTSDVEYDENGDLKLKMRLTGTNPEVDPLQPVILNLGLENNIPEMLESLQVTRAVEDVLRRRATRQ